MAVLLTFFSLQQGRDDLRSARLVPGFHEIACEVEIAVLTRESVEQHDRLEHAGRGHADVSPGRQDALLGGKGRDQEIAHLAAGVEGLLIPCVLVVSQQSDQIILVRPDIPVGPRIEAEAFFGEVGAEVAVGLLAGDQVGHHLVELGFQGWVGGVGPGQRGRVQPLADVLADPGMAAGPLAITGQERLDVDLEQPVFLVGVDPRTKPAAQVDLRRSKHLESVGQPGRHLGRHRLDGNRVNEARGHQRNGHDHHVRHRWRFLPGPGFTAGNRHDDPIMSVWPRPDQEPRPET